MQRGSFEVNILGVDGNIPREKSGYVHMRHNQQYTIKMANNRSVRCDAIVKIDGKEVGTWRLNPHQTAVIERPLDDDGRFTFYRKGSNEEKSTNTGISREDRGLVQVNFIPEQEWTPPAYPWWWQDWRYRWPNPHRPYPTPPYWGPDGKIIYHSGASIHSLTVGKSENTRGNILRACSMQNKEGLESGITGLSGQSGQKFSDADTITRDYSKSTQISLRLVVKRSRGKKKKPQHRPLLVVGSNPVPRPID